MENPMSWGPVEKTISKALTESLEARAKGICGWSTEMVIANALREAGLINEDLG